MAAQLTIGEVARRTGLSVHTLRYYEREGLFVNPPHRSSDGRRRYGEDDVDWLYVCTVLREAGMPIPDICRYTQLVREGAGTEAERLRMMQAQRERVRAQQDALARSYDLIEHKIGVYQDILEHGTSERDSGPCPSGH